MVAFAPPDSAFTRWRWRVFAATWLCYAGFYFCRKPFSIAKSALGEAFDLGPFALGALYAAYLTAYTIGQFLAGAIAPRFGPRKVLLSAMAVSVSVSVLFAVVETFEAFMALMVVNGLAQAMGWSSCVGNMASWYARAERGTAMGLWSTNFQIGGIAANALAAAMLVHGHRWAFLAGAMVLCAVWVFFAFNQADRPEDRGFPPVEPVPSVGSSEVAGRWPRAVWVTVLLIGGAYFGLKFIRYAIWSWAPFVLERDFGLRGDEAGYLATLFDVGGFLGVIVTGWLSDRCFGGKRARVAFWMIVGCVAATAFLMTAGAASVPAFALGLGLVGLTLYGPDALLTGAGAQDLGRHGGATRAAAVISGLGSAGSVLQEFVIGRMHSAGGGGELGPILATLVAAAILALTCTGVILWRNARGMSDV